MCFITIILNGYGQHLQSSFADVNYAFAASSVLFTGDRQKHKKPYKISTHLVGLAFQIALPVQEILVALGFHFVQVFLEDLVDLVVQGDQLVPSVQAYLWVKYLLFLHLNGQ